MTPVGISEAIFVGYLASLLLYWPVIQTVELLVARFCPQLCKQLRENRPRKLVPFITMIPHMLLGVFLTVPSCVIAAVTTPWGLGEGLNTAGKICIASQATIWTAEIGPMLDYSIELYLHHLTCLLVLGNVVACPSIHQIKPLYAYLASQLGDLGPGLIMILKLAGFRMETSRLLYWVVIVGTGWLVGSKAYFTLSSIGMVLGSPYRVGDWVWAFALLFFGVYCLINVTRNLKWTKVYRIVSERPRGIIVLDRLRVSVSSLVAGGAFVGAASFKVLLYSIYHERELSPADLLPVWMETMFTAALTSLVATLMALLWASLLSRASQANTARECVTIDKALQFGAILIFGSPYFISFAGHASTVESHDIAHSMAATALAFPLFETVFRLGIRAQVKADLKEQAPDKVDKEAPKEDQKDPREDLKGPKEETEPVGKDEKPVPVLEKGPVPEPAAVPAKSSMRSPRQGNFHILMAAMNMAALVCVISLPSSMADFYEKAVLMMCSHAIMYAAGTVVMAFYEDAAESSKPLSSSTVAKLAPTLVEFWIALRTSNQLDTPEGPLGDIQVAAVILGLLSSACGIYLVRLATFNGSRSRLGRLLRTLLHPVVFSVTCAAVLQWMLAREHVLQPDYSLFAATTIPFENFRAWLLCRLTALSVIMVSFAAIFTKAVMAA